MMNNGSLYVKSCISTAIQERYDQQVCCGGRVRQQSASSSQLKRSGVRAAALADSRRVRYVTRHHGGLFLHYVIIEAK